MLRAFVIECEQADRAAIVATFRRKLPRPLADRWTEVTHPRALKAQASLLDPPVA